MSGVTQILLENGLMLLCGASGLLLAGTLIALSLRSPLHQQRVCEMSLLGTLIWTSLAITPLPRLSWEPPQSLAAVNTPKLKAAPGAMEIPPELIARPPRALIEATPPRYLQTPRAMANPSINWRILVVRSYLVGALLALVWIAMGYFLLWRMISTAAPAPASVREMVDSPLRAIDGSVRILISHRLARPITCGTFWPIILLPQTLLQEISRLQLRQALLHEAGHIRQRDSLGNLLFNLALPLLYFHPLYWLLRRRAALARELVVDDLAAQTDGKEAYVEQLIELARTRSGSVFSPAGAMGMLQIRSHFYRRVQMLLERRQPLAARCSNSCRFMMTMVVSTIVIGAACLLGVRPAIAQPAAVDPTLRGQAPKANGDDEHAATKDRIEQLTAQVEALKLEVQSARARQAQDHSEWLGAAGENRDASKRRKQAFEAVHDLSEDQIAMVDQTMRTLLQERNKEKEDLQTAKQQFGPSHPTVLKLQESLEQTENKLRKYTSNWRDMQINMAQNDSGGIPVPDHAARVVGDAAHVGGVQLDLVQLGNSIVDASGALQLAQVKLNKVVNPASAVPGESIESAKVNLITAEKRIRLLAGIAKLALERAQANLDQANRLRDKGLITDGTLSDYRSKVEMLKLIIDATH